MEFISRVIYAGASIFTIILWAWAVVMLISGTLTVIFARGSNRLWGIVIIVLALVALPYLIEEYPVTLARAGVNSYAKTEPYMTQLVNNMMATFNRAVGSTGSGSQQQPYLHWL